MNLSTKPLYVLLALAGVAPRAHAQVFAPTPPASGRQAHTAAAVGLPTDPPVRMHLSTAPPELGQVEAGDGKRDTPYYRFSLSTTYLSLVNFESEETNLHHYELRIGYKLSPKDRLEIKATTWKLFAPMGIPLWDPLFRKESEWYPGRLRESGLGVTYQRLLWKDLFAQVEVLPIKKTYLDQSDTKIGDGFKLYTTYHVGYHIQFLGNRLFVEPQVHFNYWPVDSDGPTGFAEVEDRWNNYFLFEPNVYIGVKF